LSIFWGTASFQSSTAETRTHILAQNTSNDAIVRIDMRLGFRKKYLIFRPPFSPESATLDLILTGLKILYENRFIVRHGREQSCSQYSVIQVPVLESQVPVPVPVPMSQVVYKYQYFGSKYQYQYHCTNTCSQYHAAASYRLV